MPSPEFSLSPKRIEALALPDFPLIRNGDNLGQIIFETAERAKIKFLDRDIVVVAQKVVSRTEGRIKSLKNVEVSKEALRVAEASGKDPRFCQLILEDSKKVLYANERAVITEHVSGLVSGSAGLDTTNIDDSEEEKVILLPVDSDKSAKEIREQLGALSGKDIAVIITDSVGRPFRKGSVGMSIGSSGISALEQVRKKDLFGKKVYQEVALVDELSAMASPLMQEADEGNPVILIRGINYTKSETQGFKDLVRPPQEDQIWD